MFTKALAFLLKHTFLNQHMQWVFIAPALMSPWKPMRGRRRGTSCLGILDVDRNKRRTPPTTTPPPPCPSAPAGHVGTLGIKKKRKEKGNRQQTFNPRDWPAVSVLVFFFFVTGCWHLSHIPPLFGSVFGLLYKPFPCPNPPVSRLERLVVEERKDFQMY